MMLTPRQIAAYLELNTMLDGLDRASNLTIAAVGAQGDKDAITQTLKELTGQWR